MHPSRDSGGMSARAMWRLWSEEMSLPMGRGTERVRSCGLVRKRDNAGRQMERFEVLGTCIMGGVSTVITMEHSTTSGRHYMEATTTCQEKPYKDITQLA